MIKTFKFFWTTHKWLGIILAVVLVNIATSGFLLLIKKKVDWIQPSTADASAPGVLTATFDEILAAARSVPQAGIETWDDVDRLDVRPDKGLVKVRGLSRWEVQVDTATGEVLQAEYRRSDLIETIHDGSFFGDWMHGWIMPAVAVSVVYFVFSGLWLWLEPIARRRRRRRKAREAAA